MICTKQVRLLFYENLDEYTHTVATHIAMKVATRVVKTFKFLFILMSL
jgi:hypothetical protein